MLCNRKSYSIILALLIVVVVVVVVVQISKWLNFSTYNIYIYVCVYVREWFEHLFKMVDAKNTQNVHISNIQND